MFDLGWLRRSINYQLLITGHLQCVCPNLTFLPAFRRVESMSKE